MDSIYITYRDENQDGNIETKDQEKYKLNLAKILKQNLIRNIPIRKNICEVAHFKLRLACVFI